LPWTSGSMLAAARNAIAENGVACSPTSGFHHAGYSYGGGFCTVNGLMVTAMALLDSGMAGRVGIIDLDQHYGDGTDNIIERLDVQHRVFHFTAGRNYHSPSQAARFFVKLESIVKDFRESCHVILYQAGADCHVADPLGGWLTTEQMRERDRIVFDGCKGYVPLAYNHAGGYQEPVSKVIELHTNTLRECMRVYG
jgi:acetoin utilization deacetylase AcuC-like enzyme